MTSTAVAPRTTRATRQPCARVPDAASPTAPITEVERHTLLAGLPTAPSSKDQIALARRVASGDAAGRSEMVVANLRLVVYWAKKYQRSGVDLEDLVQEGAFSLIRAVERFDPERGVAFSTYASFWICQALQIGGERCARAIAIPIEVVDSARNAGTLDSLLCVAVSLDQVVSDDGTDTLADLVASDEPSPEDIAEKSWDAEAVRAAVDGLREHARSVIRLRFGLSGPKRDLRSTASALGMAHTRVRRIETEALDLLRSDAGLEEMAGMAS